MSKPASDRSALTLGIESDSRAAGAPCSADIADTADTAASTGSSTDARHALVGSDAAEVSERAVSQAAVRSVSS